MPVMVALLRGVNVGGRSRLPMADLRAVSEGLGHRGVRTYVQSGNLVFSTGDRSTDRVAAQLEAAIAATCDVQLAVVVRTAAQLGSVIDADPFVGRGEDPGSVHVTFFPGRAPSPGDVTGFAPEEVEAIGGELHLHLPDGIGRSRLAAHLARRAPEGTTRNWRTVATLHGMASEQP
jgi:uncharacterized protein (DUF1697 family)